MYGYTKNRNYNSIESKIKLENGYSGDQKVVYFGKVKLWFSYSTIVAFYTPETGFVISENIWSRTTGKHLNYIDRDKDKRINNKEFEKKLGEVLEEYNLV